MDGLKREWECTHGCDLSTGVPCRHLEALLDPHRDKAPSRQIKIVFTDKLEYFAQESLQPYAGRVWEDECRLRKKLFRLKLSPKDIEIVVDRIITCLTWDEIARKHKYSEEGSAWKKFKRILKVLKEKGFR